MWPNQEGRPRRKRSGERKKNSAKVKAAGNLHISCTKPSLKQCAGQPDWWQDWDRGSETGELGAGGRVSWIRDRGLFPEAVLHRQKMRIEGRKEDAGVAPVSCHPIRCKYMAIPVPHSVPFTTVKRPWKYSKYCQWIRNIDRELRLANAEECTENI